MAKKRDERKRPATEALPAVPSAAEMEPDWSRGCEACGAKPILPATGMCGPCAFGESETAGGNW